MAVRGKYDFFLTEKFYGFLEGRYETDKIAELDRRVIGGVARVISGSSRTG